MAHPKSLCGLGGAISLLQASLSSLQSLGVMICPTEQHKMRTKCRAWLTVSLLARGEGEPVVLPCPPSQHHTLHWFPSPGQDNTCQHSTSGENCFLGWAQGSNWDMWASWLPAQL